MHNKNSRRYKRSQATAPKVYQWYLSRFNGYRSDDEPLMEGLYSLPVADIGEGLTEEWVVLNLNVRNCFDVDYTPQEGDNLIIRDSHESWVYLSFIFKNSNWEVDHYNPFHSLHFLIMKGEVE